MTVPPTRCITPLFTLFRSIDVGGGNEDFPQEPQYLFYALLFVHYRSSSRKNSFFFLVTGTIRTSAQQHHHQTHIYHRYYTFYVHSSSTETYIPVCFGPSRGGSCELQSCPHIWVRTRHRRGDIHFTRYLLIYVDLV